MKIYNLVKKLLEDDIDLRNDDQRLQWKIWEMEGSVKNGCMRFSDFKMAANTESIRRARQLVQADHPNLQAEYPVRKLRQCKQREKGTFAYREKITPNFVFNPETMRYEEV